MMNESWGPSSASSYQVMGEVSLINLRGLIAEASTELQLESIVNLKIWGGGA